MVASRSKRRTTSKESKDTNESDHESADPWSGPARLYKAEPRRWMWMPRWLRKTLGWISIVAFSGFFLMPGYFLVLLIPFMWSTPALRMFHYGMLSLIVISCVVPMREWPAFRKVGQLWFEIFQFSSNFDYEHCMRSIENGKEQQVILAMHPHGIIPFQSVLWAAYCDEFFTNWETGDSMYGFGGAADIVCYIPFLRNWMGWMSAYSASYKVLKRGLTEGKSSVCPGREVRHCYLLPGGVAEIFTSTPGRNCIVFKSRQGLIRLALETGTKLAAVYVFGGTDFFHNLATGDSWLSKLSRRLQAGMTVFYGPFLQPFVPYAPRVSMVMGKPIDFPEGYTHGTVTDEFVKSYHESYLKDIQELFDRYKTVAGHECSELEIL